MQLLMRAKIWTVKQNYLLHRRRSIPPLPPPLSPLHSLSPPCLWWGIQCHFFSTNCHCQWSDQDSVPSEMGKLIVGRTIERWRNIPFVYTINSLAPPLDFFLHVYTLTSSPFHLLLPHVQSTLQLSFHLLLHLYIIHPLAPLPSFTCIPSTHYILP